MREKSIKAILIGLVLALLVASLLPSIPIAKVQTSFYSFAYSRTITVTNSGSTALSNYAIRLTVDTATPISQGKMRSDAGDIRFFDSDQSTLLGYWIESGINTASTVIWVKIPSIPASSSKKIYMVYGNPSLTSASNGSSVFLFFDDFSTYPQGSNINGTGGWSAITNDPYHRDYATVTTYMGRTALHLHNDAWELVVFHPFTVSTPVTAIFDFAINVSNYGYGNEFGFATHPATGSPILQQAYVAFESTSSPYWQIIAIQSGTGSSLASSSSNAPSTATAYTINFTWSGSSLFETAYKSDGSVQQPTLSATDSTFSYSSLPYLIVYANTGNDFYVFRIRVLPFTSPTPTVSVGLENAIYYTKYNTKPYPLNTVYLNHTFISSPSSFTFSLTSSNSSTASYTFPYYDNYGFKLDALVQKLSGGTQNGTSATLTATASITLPYSTQTLKNITFFALATNTGTARSLNVTLTNSGGSKIATTRITPSSSWQMYSIPINVNASGTLTLKVIMYALSSASASETVAIRDIKLFAYYYFNPSSGYFYDYATYMRSIVNNTFSITLAMPSPLNSSIVYFKIPAQFLFNKTTYATSPTYIGNETINNVIYRVYRIIGFTSTSGTDFFFVRNNALYNVKPMYKGITVNKVLVGEKIVIPLSVPTNVTIGSYSFQNVVGNFSFKIPASGNYNIVLNATDPNHWNLGYFTTSISAILGSFSASPKDAFNNALSYAQLLAYLYNATSGALVSSATFTTSTTFSNLVAGNYTVKLYYKNLLVGVGSFNLVSSTNATTMLPKVRTFRIVDYRGANIGKVLAYSSGVNLTEADISRGKAFPRGIYQLKVNGSGSFTLFVDYLGNLPTKVAISSNASGLSYGWRGSVLIINGTLGSTAVVNVTDLYKVFVDVRDMLERSLGFVPITINGSQVTPQIFTQPAYYNVSLPNMTNFFKFSKFSDGFPKTYRLITVNNSDVYVKVYYRIPISFKASVNATTTVMSAFLRMLGLQQYNTVTAHVEGKIYDYFGVGVPNKQIVVNITNLDSKVSGTFALTTDVSGYFRTPDIDFMKGAHYLISISAPDDPTYVGNSTSYTYTVQEAVAPIPSVAGIPLIYYIVGAVAVIVAIGIIIFGYKAMKHTVEDETERRRKFVRRKSVHAIEEESERKFIKKKPRGEE